jgi:hypothetical protein
MKELFLVQDGFRILRLSYRFGGMGDGLLEPFEEVVSLGFRKLGCEPVEHLPSAPFPPL